jgi:tripartite-type tricarboxylate transporter receptor subunit TctC
MLAASPLILVTGNVFPAKNVRELIAQSRANPGKYNCGSAGKGTSQHLACETLQAEMSKWAGVIKQAGVNSD